LPQTPAAGQIVLGAKGNGGGSVKELKQRMLVRDLILMQGVAQRANQKLAGNIVAVASRLPTLLPFSQTIGAVDLNQERQLLQRLNELVGVNPYDQEDQLKNEMLRLRTALQADESLQLSDNKKPKSLKNSRVFFRQSTFINPSEPVRTIDSLNPEEDARYPGTINILIDCSGAYVVFATGIEMTVLKSEGKTVFKSGQLK